MKERWRKIVAASLIVPMTLLPVLGCSGGNSSRVSPEASPNEVYYATLAANNFTDHAMAQPPDDLFAAVKHFDLTAAGAQAASLAAGGGAYVLYQPAFAAVHGAEGTVRASDLSGEGIPGFKPHDTIPVECREMSGMAFAYCMDERKHDDEDHHAPPVHISHFDGEALSVLFGKDFAAALVDKIIESKLTHIVDETRHAVAAQLTDYINDAPAHLSLDLLEHDIFDRDGYHLAGATLTDDSRGDIDGDGSLERHSTLKITISKEIDYTRSTFSTLDAIFLQYLGSVPKETYLINMQVFIHLAPLHTLRRQADPLLHDSENPPTLAQEFEQLDREWEAAWINKALDANILKRIAENPDVISWDHSEYTLSFQVSPANVTQMTQVLGRAVEAGDAYAYALVEQHLNAQTAIITGPTSAVSAAATHGSHPEVKVFYQVSRPALRKASGTSWGWDYAMLDSAGNRVAILDPTSGAVVLAEEPSKFAPSDPWMVEALWTKSGACKNDKSDWAYWPARVRTGNFGRGINWILTESILHNQVGDYKNIHWYQSAWKSTAQVAIKGGMWVVANYLKVQISASGISKNDKDYALYYILEVLMPTVANLLGDSTGHGKEFKIAGYPFQVSSLIIRFFREAKLYTKDQTFAAKAGTVIKGIIVGFLIDRVSDGVGQTLDVTVTGWQDYSDSSHYGCFAFDY